MKNKIYNDNKTISNLLLVLAATLYSLISTANNDSPSINPLYVPLQELESITISPRTSRSRSEISSMAYYTQDEINGAEAGIAHGSQEESIPSFRCGSRNAAWGVFQSFTAWIQNNSELSEIAVSKNPDNSLVTYNNLNISFIFRPVKNRGLFWNDYIRWKPSTDNENTLFQGEDAGNCFLSNIILTNTNVLNIHDPDLVVSVRNIFDEAYGQAGPRATMAPVTPFLTSYHPQESRSIILGINYHV